MKEARIWKKRCRASKQKWTPAVGSKKKWFFGYLFLAPSFLGVGIFVLIPFADVVRRSFLDAMGNQSAGLDNYRAVLENEAFQQASGNTIRFIAVCIPLLMLLSLLCALLVNQIKVCKEFFKTTFLFPLAIPVASVVLLWRLFLDTNGFFNAGIKALNLSPVNWMSSSSAFYVLVFTYLWKNTGYDMILWIAGLSAIPMEQYEAARIDGAGRWQCFRYVTLPGLAPSGFVIVILSLVNCFKVFREAYLIAGDYPHESIYMMQHLFNNWFVSLDMQKMTAAAVLMAAVMIILMLFVWHQNERSRKWEEN